MRNLTQSEREHILELANRRNSALLEFQRGILQSATVVLSIATPLAASRPPEGIARWTLPVAIAFAALAVLSGWRLLYAPARQDQEILEAQLSHFERSNGFLPLALSAQTGIERLCRKLLPWSAVLSVLLLVVSALIA